MKQHSSKLGCALGARRVSKNTPPYPLQNFLLLSFTREATKKMEEIPGVKRELSGGFMEGFFPSFKGLSCSRQVHCSWRFCKCRDAQLLLCCS